MREIKNVTDLEFQDQLSQHKQIIVKFYADWCGSCKLIAPKYRKLAEDERFADVAFLDINAEQNPKARTLAGVDNLPYFAIFKEGQLVKGDATSKIEAVEQMLLALQN